MRRFVPLLVASIILTALWMPGERVSGQAEALPRGTLWQKSILNDDGLSWVGQYNSIAVDPSSGQTYISYYDQTDGDLKVASSVMAGSGNCDPGMSWLCSTVDTTGDRGVHSSIAIDPVTHQPAVAYFDSTNEGLVFAERSCTLFTGCRWTPVDIGFEAEDPDQYFSNGLYGISLAFDSAGIAHIAYHMKSASGESGVRGSLVYASYNLVTHLSNITAIDFRPDKPLFGANPSLVIDSLSHPHIAYRGETEGLKYAEYVGTGGTGCTGIVGEWNCASIDPDLHTQSISLQIGADGKPQIAYATLNTGKEPDELELRYATKATPGGNNCIVSNGWRCITLDSIGEMSAIYGQMVAMALDAEDDPIIAYHSGGDVRIAELVGLGGNCGPGMTLPSSEIVFYAWSCNVIVKANSFTMNGGHLSIATTASGLPRVAYTVNHDAGANYHYHLGISELMYTGYVPYVKR